MSGSNRFARSARPHPGPVVEKLGLEDNRRIFRFLGSGNLLAGAFIGWALTVKLVIPHDLYEKPTVYPPDRLQPPEITVKPDFYEKIEKQRIAKRPPRPTNAPEPASRRPSRENGNLQVRPIESRREDPSLSAYAIIDKALKGVDMEKIEKAATLTRTDPTRIAGRRGRYTEKFNEAYSADGDGKGTEFGLTRGGKPSAIGVQARGPEGIKSTEITVSNEGRFRSSESILREVRARSPGLRHLYNSHLKRTPGLGGKITLRFAISPSGIVVDAAMVSGTTGSAAFEEEVLRQVRTWKFGPIAAQGNDIVTVPFNFSE
jgi:TonB family protein